MTRSTGARPVRPLGKVRPTRSSQAGCGPAKKFSTLRRAIAAKSSRRSNEISRPASVTARSRLQVSAPDPAPASSTRAPGKMSARHQDLGRVLGVDHRGAARHGHGELVEQRPQREERGAARRGARPALPAGRSARRARRRPWWCGTRPPGASTIECRRPLGSVRVIRSPTWKGPIRTPDRCGRPGQPFPMPPQAQLPARPEGAVARSRPPPGRTSCSSDWLIGSMTRSLAAWRCSCGQQLVGGRRFGGAAELGLGGVRPARPSSAQRRVQVGLQPGQRGRRPGLAVDAGRGRPRLGRGVSLTLSPPVFSSRVRIWTAMSWRVRGRRVVAEGQVDPVLPGHLGRGLAAQREAGDVSRHPGRDQGVRGPVALQGERDGGPQRLVPPGRGARGPVQLQDADAGSRVFPVKPLAVCPSGFCCTCCPSRVTAAALRPAPDHLDRALGHGVLDRAPSPARCGRPARAAGPAYARRRRVNRVSSSSSGWRFGDLERPGADHGVLRARAPGRRRRPPRRRSRRPARPGPSRTGCRAG